ncbi:atypical membrane-integrating protein (Mistic protein) [Virgibacillus sp. FSP13]
MKATELESKRFDKALDEILDLFNNLEQDKPVIQFGDDVLDNIERAKEKYGDETIDERINKLVREMLAWLDLDDVELGDQEKETSDEEE